MTISPLMAIDLLERAFYDNNMNTHSVEQVSTSIKERFKASWFASERLHKPRWMVEEFSLPRRDLLSLVDQFPDAWLFSNVGGSRLGIGVAQRWTYSGPDAWPEWKRQWAALIAEEQLDPRLQVAGGVAFSLEETASRAPWTTFPRMSWTLPAVLVETGTENLKATIVARVDASLPLEPVVTYYQSLVERIGKPPALAVSVNSTLIESHSTPNHEAWCRLVESAVSTIRSRALSKVVLARALATRFTEPISVSQVLDHLVHANPEAQVFALRMQSKTFLGATPELLLSAQGKDVFTMALAGSAPRGATPHLDHVLAQNLLTHQKNVAEHAAVKNHILGVMARSSTVIKAPARPSIKRLPTVQHLYTPITAQLLAEHTVWDLAEALAPTPAVGGHPASAAVDWILDHEPFDRGWYAGIVGHVDLTGNGTLLVALRSALVDGSEATLFGGCGIMAESRPEEEWKESQWKIQSMLQAMGVEEWL